MDGLLLFESRLVGCRFSFIVHQRPNCNIIDWVGQKFDDLPKIKINLINSDISHDSEETDYVFCCDVAPCPLPPPIWGLCPRTYSPPLCLRVWSQSCEFRAFWGTGTSTYRLFAEKKEPSSFPYWPVWPAWSYSDRFCLAKTTTQSWWCYLTSAAACTYWILMSSWSPQSLFCGLPASPQSTFSLPFTRFRALLVFQDWSPRYKSLVGKSDRCLFLGLWVVFCESMFVWFL